MVTFPTESGFQGGKLEVHSPRPGIPGQTFNCSAGSEAHVYYTFYRSACGLKSEPIEAGSRVAAIFDLSYPLGNAHLLRPSLPDLMRSWNQHDFGRLLAFPLFQHYTKSTDKLTFAGLKGDDQRLVSLLSSVGSLQLHLAVMVTHKRGPVSLFTRTLAISFF